MNWRGEMPLSYIKAKKIILANNTDFNEDWLKKIIIKDPAILGLGDLILIDKERRQPHAGILDLLFEDPDIEDKIRYEVEVQLGELNASHIIRTIEYWDIERRRYPQYKHIAVIVAEDITRRFLNVINLFNGALPLIAIQLNAISTEDKNISLVFTKIFDANTFGPDDEDEASNEKETRDYWDKKATPRTVSLADDILKLLKDSIKDKVVANVELKYTKYYIGLMINNKAINFIKFQPQKNSLKFIFRIPEQLLDDELKKDLLQLELKPYQSNDDSFEIRINNSEEIEEYKDSLIKLLQKTADYKGIYEL